MLTATLRRALLAGLFAFVLLATSASASAKLTVKAAPTADPTGLTMTVTISGGSGRLTAHLQRKDGKRWITMRSAKVKQGKASLRWSKGQAGTAYGFRVQVLRGKRVLATTPSLRVKLPAGPPVAQPSPKPSAGAPPEATPGPAPGPLGPPWMPTVTPEPVPEIAEHSLSLGGTTGCRIDGADRHVRCWGASSTGQLGDGGYLWRPYAAAVPGMTDARSVAVGASHACAALKNGTVWCWGDDFRAQLGRVDLSAPNPFPAWVPVSRVLSLVSGPGADFTCVNRLERAPMCWGTVPEHLLGPDLPEVLTSPTTIPALEGATIVSASSSRVCVRWTARATDPSSAQCLAPNPAEFGRTDAGEIHGSSASVVQLAAGEGGSCSLRAAGAIHCEASAGRTYVDPTADLTNWTAPRVLDLTIPGTRSIAVGSGTACAARGALPVRCWGAGPFIASTPFDVPGTAGMVSVEAAGNGYCGADEAGAIRCWGSGSLPGMIGNVGIAPIPLKLDGDFTTPGISDELGCGVRDGGVECWGRTPGTSASPGTYDGHRPTKIPGTADIVEVVAMRQTACGRRSDGKLLCWGVLPQDMAAPGVQPPVSNAPAMVVPDLADVTDLSDASSGLCVRRGGSAPGIVCLGALRRGAWTAGSARGIEPGTQDATKFAVGDSLTSGYGPASLCFVTGSPGTVRCLRDGSSVPVTIAGTSGATDVALGTNHGCAIVGGGKVRCWGLARSQLGFSPDVLSDQRIEDAREVTGLAGATALALGFSHSCAIVGSGDVSCWGDSDVGALGQPGWTGNSTTPQLVPRLHDASTITSSVATVCATRTGHALTCWGSAWYSVPRPSESDPWLGVPLTDERDLPAL